MHAQQCSSRGRQRTVAWGADLPILGLEGQEEPEGTAGPASCYLVPEERGASQRARPARGQSPPASRRAPGGGAETSGTGRSRRKETGQRENSGLSSSSSSAGEEVAVAVKPVASRHETETRLSHPGWASGLPCRRGTAGQPPQLQQHLPLCRTSSPPPSALGLHTRAHPALGLPPAHSSTYVANVLQRSEAEVGQVLRQHLPRPGCAPALDRKQSEAERVSRAWPRDTHTHTRVRREGPPRREGGR